MSREKLRQRMVGAVVLLSLGVILWNWLLTDEAPIMLDRDSKLPPEPVVERFTVPEPRKPADVPAVDTVLVEEAEPAAPPADGLDAHGLPVAWVLQVASLSNKDAANSLKQRLQAQGHKAYIESTRNDGKTLYRVLVGPKISRELADQAKTDIDKAFKVNAIIQRFNP